MFKEKSDLEEFIPMNQNVDSLINSVFMDKIPDADELEANEFYFCCVKSLEYTSKSFMYY